MDTLEDFVQEAEDEMFVPTDLALKEYFAENRAEFRDWIREVEADRIALEQLRRG